MDASYQLTWRSRLPEWKASGRPTILETCSRQQLKYELFGWVGVWKKERFTSRKASSANLTVHAEKSQVLFFPSSSLQVLVKMSASFRRRIFPSFSLPITTYRWKRHAPPSVSPPTYYARRQLAPCFPPSLRNTLMLLRPATSTMPSRTR